MTLSLRYQILSEPLGYLRNDFVEAEGISNFRVLSEGDQNLVVKLRSNNRRQFEHKNLEEDLGAHFVTQDLLVDSLGFDVQFAFVGKGVEIV